MTTATRKASSIRITAVAMICLSSANAAEKLSWQDLQTRFGGIAVCRPEHICYGMIEHRSIDVYRRDGAKHHTRRLLIDSDGLRLYGRSMESLPRERVTRIQIRTRGKYLHNLHDTALLALLPALGFTEDASAVGPLLAIIFTPPLLAGVALATPVFLVLDGISFFTPAKTYEITP